MENVNKQLLDALEQLVRVVKLQRPCGSSVHKAEKAIAAAEQAQQAEPVAQCPNCLGTKRQHALDPEWKGRCECAAQPPAQQQAEPVAWRYIRSADGEVLHDTVELMPWPPAQLRYTQKHFDVEIVPLYAQPPAVAVAALLNDLSAYAPLSGSLCAPTALQGFAIRAASMLSAMEQPK